MLIIQTMQTQIRGLLQEPSDLDLQCLIMSPVYFKPVYMYSVKELLAVRVLLIIDRSLIECKLSTLFDFYIPGNAIHS